MTLASLECMKKHAKPRTFLHNSLSHSFAIHQTEQSFLSTYFIRYWSKEYFFRITSVVSLHTGTIPLEGKEFVIVYHRCTRGEILALESSDQLALSFRAALPEFSLPAYVLVSKKSRLNS